MKKNPQPDYILLGIIIILLLIGLLILGSVSFFLAEKKFANPFYYFLHQIFFGIVLGGIFGVFAYKISLIKLRKWSFIFLLLNIFLLILVFVPQIGWEYGGAVRWVKIGKVVFQPSEFLKITFPLYLASWLSSRLSKKRKSQKKAFSLSQLKLRLRISDFSERFLPFLIILFVISILLILEPDMSTLVLIAGVAILMYFIANTPLWHNLLILILTLSSFLYLIQISPYRFSRIQVFFNPNLDPMGSGYQSKQALIAVGSGGIFGKGLGLSQQKLGFLPQSLGDSIFAIFAEETGFLGTSFLLFLFVIFFWRGMKIFWQSQDLFYKLLAFAITSQITLQAFINIGALIGILPLTGIPLPFISYGGSHLATELISIGILLNISKFK